MAFIEIRNIHKWFGDLHVLDEVSLSVDSGQVVVVCGPSGSGKSTLLRCINHLENIQEGEIFVDGTAVNSESARAVRKNVGMVFQHFELFPHKTVLENCTLGPTKGGGADPEVINRLASESLTRVGLRDKAHTYPASLSGGQKQRAAIVRALCLQPKVLLFDEPTSALDPEMIAEVLEVMADLAQDGITMIIVTHEIGFAQQAADDVVYMEEGRVIERNQPISFFSEPQSQGARRFLSKVLH